MRWLWTCLSRQLNTEVARIGSGVTWCLPIQEGRVEVLAEEEHILRLMAGTQTWPCFILGSQGCWEAQAGRFRCVRPLLPRRGTGLGLNQTLTPPQAWVIM